MTTKQKNIYLDYAAATPLDPKVKKAMEPFLKGEFGNPSSMYASGRKAKQGLDGARISIAKSVNAKPSEIIFTAGGSESINLAIFGVAKNHLGKKAHFITSAIEHHAVLNSFKALEEMGFKTSYIGVDNFGLVSLEELKKLVRPETVFISVMYANNEIGTVQHISEIGKWLKHENHNRRNKGQHEIVFHTDACQAAGFLDLNVNNLGIDLMSVNGSKIYGPKQTGFLYVRSGVNLKPIVYGGGQEKDLRGGTENVAGAVGLAKAIELAVKDKTKESKRLISLSTFLVNQIKAKVKQVLLNGYEKYELKTNNLEKNKLIRLPNSVNFTFKDVEGEALMLYLDAEGFEVSTASACSTANPNEPSHVLVAIGRGETQAKSSIRFTLGKFTKKEDLVKLVRVLPKLIDTLSKVKKI